MQTHATIDIKLVFPFEGETYVPLGIATKLIKCRQKAVNDFVEPVFIEVLRKYCKKVIKLLPHEVEADLKLGNKRAAVERMIEIAGGVYAMNEVLSWASKRWDFKDIVLTPITVPLSTLIAWWLAGVTDTSASRLEYLKGALIAGCVLCIYNCGYNISLEHDSFNLDLKH